MEECPYRMVTCRYCAEPHQFNLNTQGVDALAEQDPVDRFLGFSVHESHCGNRTVTCRECTNSVMIRSLNDHFVINHHKQCTSRLELRIIL